MAKTWSKAVCPCRKVEMRVLVDLAEGTRRCNCTCCRKRGWWSVAVPPDAVEVVEGAEDVVEDEGNPYWQGRRCGSCGVTLFGTVSAPEAGGPRAIVNVRLLEGVSFHEVPVEWLDGLHDTWASLGTTVHREPEPVRFPVEAPAK